jgi:hypothetical protein
MNAPNILQVDHIDHNGLNNQKSNLRICTLAENRRNRRARGKSKYLGVYYDNGYIRAVISVNGIQKRLGYFKIEETAAMAYDKAATIYHKEFANLNFK